MKPITRIQSTLFNIIILFYKVESGENFPLVNNTLSLNEVENSTAIALLNNIK